MMSLQLLLQSPLTLRLGWTIVHSLWQLLAMGMLLAICLPMLRRRSSQLASAACGMALSLCGLIPLVTFVLQPGTTNDVWLPVEQSSSIHLTPRSLEMSEEKSQDDQISGLPEVSAPVHEVVRTNAVAGVTTSNSTENRIQAPTAISPSWRFQDRLRGILPLVVAAWGIGVVILSIWNCGAWFAARQLIVSSTIPVTSQIEQTASHLARQLGLHQAVRLLQSALVESPVVIGVFKPVVLLPMALVLQLPPDQLDALLAHELAHILRRDYLLNLLQTIVETLLFYHPVVWWISAQVRQERENCCDDLVLQLAVNRVVYVQALAAVAGARASTSLTAANGGQLIHRLQRIMGITQPETFRPARWLAGVSLLALCGLVAGMTAMTERKILADNPATSSKSDEKKPVEVNETKPDKQTDVKELLSPTATTSGTMRIRVTGPDGTRLSDAKVQTAVWTDEKDGKSNQQYKTDAEGVAVVALPKTLKILRIWASQDGYRTRFQQWWPEKHVNQSIIPNELEVSLEKGTKIGGVINNDAGQPISGVQVQVWGLASGDPKTIDGALITDENGRWSLNNVPADKEDIQLFLTHPDYISDKYFSGLQREQNITIASLRDQSSTIVMSRGVSMTGRVVDPEGKPVEKAVIIWGDNPYFDWGSQEVLTDVDGQFRLPTLALKPIRVTVVAKGWMPDSKIVNVQGEMPAVDFQLRSGKSLRLRIVDQSGTPIDDVYVHINKWRNASALYNDSHPNVINTQIPAKSDKDGVFEWAWSPEDSITFDFYKEGFASTTKSFVASEAIQTLVMSRSSTVSGTVRDARTGSKIDKFTMVAINYYSESFLGVERMNQRPFSDGQFAYEFSRTDLKQGLQIEALGYRTFRTPKRYQGGDEGDVYDVLLEPVDSFKGKVVSSQGMPVSDATVFVATEYEHLRLHNLSGDRGNDSYRVKSDSSGEFEVIPQSERYVVVAISAEGYGEIQREANELPGEVRLKPWAKLKGRVIQAGQPVAKQQVYFRRIGFVSSGEPNYRCDLVTTTDEDGQFAFERIAPIVGSVQPYLHFSRESALKSSRSLPLDPQPGETLNVVLGGDAQVSGQLVVENAPADFDYHFSLSYLVAKRPGIKVPESLAQKGFDWRKGWSDSWRGTQEGNAYLDTLHHWFVKPDPDGKINISGVEPGDYELAINLYGSTEGCLVYPLAKTVIPIKVESGQRKLELGKLMVPALPVPQVGDTAGEFLFADTTGKQTGLSAMRGKYVLIDFWASWCGPCMTKLPEVELLRKTFGTDGALIVVGANLDEDIEKARAVIRSKQFDWKHALLGEWSTSSIPRQFGISGLPTYVLVDPVGKIAVHSQALKDVEDYLQVVGLKKQLPQEK